MPDYFVPLDTSYLSNYYRTLYNRGILNQFVLNYVDENREKLKAKYPEFNNFYEKFESTDDFLIQLSAYAESKGLTMNDSDFSRSKEHIQTVIKAYIARDLWNSSEFYQVYNTKNESYLKAIEVLKDTNKYQAALQTLN